MMTYYEAKEYLEECGRKSGILPGLLRMERLLFLLGNPQEELSVIHIAGTNGKGSTAAYLAGIFSEAGYKTGRFASPAVFGTREMFLITDGCRNGKEYPKEVRAVGQPGTRTISREEFSSLISGLKEVASRMEQEPCGAPTRFELETAMAFLYFQKEQCDIVLIEAGLGGREDATNVLTRPLASVITSISYDHQGFLGQTIGEIAAKKAGIVKEGCPVFSYDQEVMGEESKDVIRKEAEEKHASLVFADFSKLQEVPDMAASGAGGAAGDVLCGSRFLPGERTGLEPGNAGEDAFCGSRFLPGERTGSEPGNAAGDAFCNSRFLYKGMAYETRLLGKHQFKNAALAIEVARGFAVPEECIQRGIQKAYWPGRLERIARNPDVILDGAHNPDAAKGLAAALRKYFPGKQIVSVMGLFADKDYKKIVSYTLPLIEKTFCVTTHTKRALDAESLCKEIQEQGGCAEACMSIPEAVEKAVRAAGTDGVVVVFGSLSFLQDVRKILETKTPDVFFRKEGSSKGGEKTSVEEGKFSVGKSPGRFLSLEMERINALWRQPEFQTLLWELEEKEKDRQYCRHGREHIFAVARLMWIFCLERPDAEKISKELVYAAAFLHDIGRAGAKKEHAEKSAGIAGKLLPLCGYSGVETALVQSAICMHGQVKKTYGSWEEIHKEVSEAAGNSSGKELLYGLTKAQQKKALWLSEALLKADHDSRDCYACSAREGCYWSEERKVSWINA